MRGSSRQGALASQQALDASLEAGADGGRLAEELFAATEVVEGNASLRRALADPSRDGHAKAGLARSVFGGHVHAAAIDLIVTVAGQRWAAERDLSDMLESLAVQARLAVAERAGRIDRVEDELFRFERVVAADPSLRDVLSSRNTDATGKAGVVTRLLEGKVAPETLRLARQAVRLPRGRRLDRIMETYLELAARRRDEMTALVTVAAPLGQEQQARLADALERHYGRRVTLQIVRDPAVMGGVRVQVGDEVVDGTVLRRLDEARRHITGA
jgi:F-type H+-transporting ATPase subunit delta